MSLTTTVAFIQNNQDRYITPAKESETEEFVRGAEETLDKLSEVIQGTEGTDISPEAVLAEATKSLVGFNPYDEVEFEANKELLGSDYNQGVYSLMELVGQVYQTEVMAELFGMTLEELGATLDEEED